MSRTTTESTAYHEAGHAVASIFLEVGIKHATIKQSEDAAGHVLNEKLRKPETEAAFYCTPSAADKLERRVQVGLAGTIAQRRFRPHSVRSRHGLSDRKLAVNLASQLTGSIRELETLLKLLHIRAEQLIENRWYAVEAVALALLERKTMTGNEIRKVCQDATMAYIKATSARGREQLAANRR